MLALVNSKQMSDLNISHHIFVVNPIEQVDYVQKNVKVTLKNTEVLWGVVYTIDPVSQCVVLGSSDKSNPKSVRVIMKHSIDLMEEISDENIKLGIDIDKDFAPDNSNVLTDDQQGKVKSWLEKNLIPVTEHENILKVESLEIHPPYGPDQCYSTNSIVLCRIQNLLNQMPNDLV